jgi:hypothetical protein
MLSFPPETVCLVFGVPGQSNRAAPCGACTGRSPFQRHLAQRQSSYGYRQRLPSASGMVLHCRPSTANRCTSVCPDANLHVHPRVVLQNIALTFAPQRCLNVPVKCRPRIRPAQVDARSLKRPERVVPFRPFRPPPPTARSSGVPPTFCPLVSRAQLRLTA